MPPSSPPRLAELHPPRRGRHSPALAAQVRHSTATQQSQADQLNLSPGVHLTGPMTYDAVQIIADSWSQLPQVLAALRDCPLEIDPQAIDAFLDAHRELNEFYALRVFVGSQCVLALGYRRRCDA